MQNPPAQRAVLLSGARQIGKTTLLLQTIESLLLGGVPPGQILYATFDHPLLKLAGFSISACTMADCWTWSISGKTFSSRQAGDFREDAADEEVHFGAERKAAGVV